MVPPSEPSVAARRKHTTGEATQVLLMGAAERLFAHHGVDGVTLRQIQTAAGQSNSSVITYHFGSKDGLVRALVEFRYARINARRAELLVEARADGSYNDPRAAVWVIVRPLVESIQAGEMFVPFLAALSANSRTLAEYLPDEMNEPLINVLHEMLPHRSAEMPDRAVSGRDVQLYSSVLNLLGAQARSAHRISDAQLNNYIDGWAGMLSAPMSSTTAELMVEE